VKIVLNGHDEIFLQPITLKELIAIKGWDPAKIVVELNLEIISKNSWGNIFLAENDRLEILSFIGGG
jgi:thiamine biosynthesis protein ThiS